jgi:hypothetical protein
MGHSDTGLNIALRGIKAEGRRASKGRTAAQRRAACP